MTVRRLAVAALAELPADTRSYRRVCAPSQAAGHKPNQPAWYGACAEQDRLSRVLVIVCASLLGLPKEIKGSRGRLMGHKPLGTVQIGRRDSE